MNEYSGMPEKTAALSSLKDLSVLLDEIGYPEWEIHETTSLVVRFKEVVSNVHGRLSLASASFVTVSWLEEIERVTQDLNNLAQSLKDSVPAVNEDIRAAQRRVDALLEAAALLPAIPLETTERALEKALEQFSSQVAIDKAAMSQQAAVVQSQLADSRDKLERIRSDLNEYLNNQRQEVHTQVAQATNSLNELEGRTNEAVGRLERDVSSNQELFRQAQEYREQTYLDSQSQLNQEFHNRLDPTVEEIENLRDQAKGMLEEVAGASSAEHYARQRDNQKKSADLWRIIGVVALVTLVFAAGYIFFNVESAGQEFSLTWILARSGVLLSLGGLAGYALRQSGQHRRREEEVARVASELMLLWPFMSRLPEEERKNLMLGITPLYFKGGISVREQGEHVGRASRVRESIAERFLGQRDN